MASPAASSWEVLSRPQRLFLGLLVLLGVDVIWVGSSELTEFIFKDMQFDKPFFSTYFKTSLFMLYLLGFLLHKPWRQQCAHWDSTSAPAPPSPAASSASASSGLYQPVNDSDESPFHVATHADDDDDDDATQHESSSTRSAFTERSSLSTSSSFVGSPTYVAANLPPSDSARSSAAEESDVEMNQPNGKRRVRFKNVAQVVEMHPADALYANLARLSYSASLRAQAALRRAASRLSIREVVQLALLFCFPWFLGNYCYQKALSNTEAAVVNILSSTSCLFTLILAAVFPSEDGDRFTLSKLFAVCFSIVGVVLVSYSDLELEDGIPSGALWTLAGAFFYSTYIVLLRRKVNHEGNMDSPMFFGFVGLFNASLLWPGLPFFHLVGWETFQLPNATQLQFLILNGIIGTVLSELLWLWGCFLTSSLVATLAISLTIPLSILADIVWKNKAYGPIFFIGAVPMFSSFFLVAMLAHYEDWDPLLDLCKAVISKCKGLVFPASRNSFVFDRHERESLISQESSHDEHI